MINITSYCQTNWLLWGHWRVLYNRISLMWCSFYVVFVKSKCLIYPVELFTFLCMLHRNLSRHTCIKEIIFITMEKHIWCYYRLWVSTDGTFSLSNLGYREKSEIQELIAIGDWQGRKFRTWNRKNGKCSAIFYFNTALGFWWFTTALKSFPSLYVSVITIEI